MDAAVLGLVLASSLLHVGWNAQAKGAGDKLAFLWLASLLPAAAGVVLLACAVAAGDIDRAAAACFAASGVVHALYFWALGAAYERADLSFVYPYSRAAGAVLGIAGGFALFGDRAGAVAATGIALTVVASFVEAAASHPARGRASRTPLPARALAMTLATGVTIAAYQLIDKVGVAHLEPIVYLPGLVAVSTVLLTPLVIFGRGRAWRQELARARFGIAAASLFLVASYVLVLIAMTRAPVSYVVAARASGIAVSALAGLLLFRERVTNARWLAVLLVTIGVYLIGAG